MSKPPPPFIGHDFDPQNIDIKALAQELREIRAELDKEVGQEDLDHLKKIERWGKICTLLGYGTAWMAPNPVSSVLISQGILTRWLLMHHISHRGYDKVPGVEPKYTSKVFGKGWRRLVDWMDWIYPEAWHEEHDFLHHYHLGEDNDPDLLERNTAWMREQGLPRWMQQSLIGGLALTWKWVYYAPSTMEVLQKARARRAKEPAPEPVSLFNPLKERGREFWLKCLLPHGLWRFAAIPALFAPLGPAAVANVFLNTVGAELFTNVHAFLVIGPNHTGEDLYRFDEPIKERDEFYLRQIVGSANYATGTELVDWTQMWLNYQIEHHIWPDMTMLQYRKAQPRVEALCKRMGIPYIQESVFTRARKMVEVVLGDSSMIRVDGLM